MMRKMKSCLIMLLVILFATILICSTAVEKSEHHEVQQEAAKEPEQYGRPRCSFGCCGRRGPYGCTRCCRPNEKATELTNDEIDGEVEEGVSEPDQIVRGPPIRCRFGCCLSGRFGCLRCCRASAAAEGESESESTVVVVEEEVKGTDQYRGGRSCRTGCCLRGRYGCARCCRPGEHAAEEGNKAAETTAASP